MLSNHPLTRIAMVAAIAGALMASPSLAEAQKKNDRRDADRPELIRRGDDVQQQRRNSSAQQGPAFCRSGAGHPVHGRRWCEERGYGVYNQGRHDSRVYDRSGSTDRNRRGANNYESAHLEFHRTHDRQCQARAAERPLDLQHQIRMRNDCRQRHEEWHRRAGRSH